MALWVLCSSNVTSIRNATLVTDGNVGHCRTMLCTLCAATCLQFQPPSVDSVSTPRGVLERMVPRGHVGLVSRWIHAHWHEHDEHVVHLWFVGTPTGDHGGPFDHDKQPGEQYHGLRRLWNAVEVFGEQKFCGIGLSLSQDQSI